MYQIADLKDKWKLIYNKKLFRYQLVSALCVISTFFVGIHFFNRSVSDGILTCLFTIFGAMGLATVIYLIILGFFRIFRRVDSYIEEIYDDVKLLNVYTIICSTAFFLILPIVALFIVKAPHAFMTFEGGMTTTIATICILAFLGAMTLFFFKNVKNIVGAILVSILIICLIMLFFEDLEKYSMAFLPAMAFVGVLIKSVFEISKDLEIPKSTVAISYLFQMIFVFLPIYIFS